MHNYMKLEIKALPQNEGFARATVAAFSAFLNPSIDDVADIKTVVSEAVTNAIVHGYRMDGGKTIFIEVELEDDLLIITIKDYGVGIADIATCLKDNYTTDDKGERSGLGFTIIKALSDGMEVKSAPGEGTTVVIKKQIA